MKQGNGNRFANNACEASYQRARGTAPSSLAAAGALADASEAKPSVQSGKKGKFAPGEAPADTPPADADSSAKQPVPPAPHANDPEGSVRCCSSQPSGHTSSSRVVVPPPLPPLIKHQIADIEGLRSLEDKLKNSCQSPTSSVERDAKANMLKYLQIQVVLQFHAEYDGLFYELNKEGGLERLRNIAPLGSKPVQPKVLVLQDCDEDTKLTKQLDGYLADAEFAKKRLDEIVTEVGEGTGKCEVKQVEVKSPGSTKRKAINFCGGDVRKITDMARVSMICDTPEAFEEVYVAVTRVFQEDILRVANGFKSDWMPGGYRDIKVNPVVRGHLCEIQLQLREFFNLKECGQHAVYRWARDLNVTTEMKPEDLFESLSGEVTKEMIRLAQQNWQGTGYCLHDIQFAAGLYAEAEKGFRETLSEAEEATRCLRDDDKESRKAFANLAAATANLGFALGAQGKHAEAKPFSEGSLAILKKVRGPDHPDVAAVLNNWAELLCAQGKYEEAAQLNERSRTIREKVLGPDHPAVATVLNTQAGILKRLGKYADAEGICRRSQAIQEEALGCAHPTLASTLQNRADLLRQQGKYHEARKFCVRAISIAKKALGPDHPLLAVHLNNWAILSELEGKYHEADPLYVQAIKMDEKALGLDHLYVATWLSNRAMLLREQGKYAEADSLSLRAIKIGERTLGPDHDDLATLLNNRAAVLEDKDEHKEAKELYERALAIRKEALGPDHPAVAESLNNLAGLLKAQGNYAEAEALLLQCQNIEEKVLSTEHPSLAITLNNRAMLLELQDKLEEAEPLYRSSLAIDKKAYGPDHPEVATDLNNLAELLRAQGKYKEAEPLYESSLAIRRKVLGPNHPAVATVLNNQALLLESQEKYDEAKSLMKKALSIFTEELGREHSLTVSCRDSLEIMEQEVVTV